MEIFCDKLGLSGKLIASPSLILGVKLMDTQMEVFDKCVAIVLAKLYEAFPLRRTIKYSDIPEELFDESDLTTPTARKFEIYEATIRWLYDADYIWASDLNGPEACNVVLTPKAFEVLKMPSSISKQQESLGQLLINAVKDGAKDVLTTAVSGVLTAGFMLL